jgi:formylglycine-generating enzyme required for sulfatase activity
LNAEAGVGRLGIRVRAWGDATRFVSVVLFGMLGCGSATEPAKTPAEKAPVVKTPDAATVKKHKTPAQLVLGDPVVNSVGMQFKLLPGGTFKMGEGNEVHPVTLTTPFELGVYEVTQEQYQKVMGSKPSKFKGP